MPESTQHKLDRVRRPRVQITYDVETLGSIVKTELPFVVGIMADLSGNAIPTLHNQPANTNLTPLKDRKFVEIDRDNFNVIMEKLEPTVKLATGAELAFKSLDDFDPIKVLGQVQILKDMFDSRTRLSNLVAKLDGNVALQKEFIDAYNSLGDKTPLKTYYNTVKAPPQAPGTIRITPAVTTGVAQTAAGLVITPAPEDATRAKFFKITDIKGGKLFKTDGTTPISNNDPIDVAIGKAGLKFTPASNSPGGSFIVGAVDKDNVAVSSFPPQTAQITVKKAQGS